MAENKFPRDGGCKEAVCVDAGRVYDSCCDKDCIENMRLFFSERDQMLVDHANGIRTKKAEKSPEISAFYLFSFRLMTYFVPKRRSPASPSPGRMYPCSLRHLSRVET